MAHEEGYIWGVGAVRRSEEHQEGKGRKKKERERKERKRGKEKREREGEERKRERRIKGKRCSNGRNLLDQEVKSVHLTKLHSKM